MNGLGIMFELIVDSPTKENIFVKIHHARKVGTGQSATAKTAANLTKRQIIPLLESENRLIFTDNYKALGGKMIK